MTDSARTLARTHLPSRSAARRTARLLLSLALVATTQEAVTAAAPEDVQASTPAASPDSLTARIRSRLEHPPADLVFRVRSELIQAPRVLPQLYERRLHAPLWVASGGPTPAGEELIAQLAGATGHGLAPDLYHYETIRRLSDPRAVRDTGALADLDILLTDAFLLFAAHLASGRLDPESLDPEWVARPREIDVAAAAERAASTSDPAAEISAILPRHAGYQRLVAALATYRASAAAGGWPSVDPGGALRPGDDDPRIVQVRRRLLAEPGNGALSKTSTLYDDELARVVESFQARHGLGTDGIIGERTLAALNETAADRVLQIELNLERWRWLPIELGRRHVLVNIADFTLQLVEQGRPDLEMKVAVGRPYRRTPVFSDVIRYLVLNPYWEVPHRLAVQDKLPEIRKDPDYLAAQGFKVFRGWSDPNPVDPATIDWQAMSPSNFPYRLRQDPGPLNALGRVKFMFPNRFNVYLHDTPTPAVFAKPERDVSSGCIRLEQPMQLLAALTHGSARWTPAAIGAALATGRETVVNLESPVPVHLLYWTAWVDDVGSVQFRRDIYARDSLLGEALAEYRRGRAAESAES